MRWTWGLYWLFYTILMTSGFVVSREQYSTLTETREPPFLGSQWPFSNLHEFIAPSVLRCTMAVEGLKRKAATALVEADDEETVSYSLIDKLQVWMSLFVWTCFHGFCIRLNSQTTYHLSWNGFSFSSSFWSIQICWCTDCKRKETLMKQYMIMVMTAITYEFASTTEQTWEINFCYGKGLLIIQVPESTSQDLTDGFWVSTLAAVFFPFCLFFSIVGDIVLLSIDCGRRRKKYINGVSIPFSDTT